MARRVRNHRDLPRRSHGNARMMCQPEAAEGALSREQFIIKMARVLVDCIDPADPIERLMAYCRAGYLDEQIIEHDTECARRETIRRAIYNLGQKAAAE